MDKLYCAIDNGVTGSITFLLPNGNVEFIHTPIKNSLNYQKTKETHINRVDMNALMCVFENYKYIDISKVVIMERPFVNPKFFNASLSAVRCFEMELSIAEYYGYSINFLDSKAWQKEMLPAGVSGKALKKVSKEVGQRLFPNLNWKGFKDADSLLMAEYARRHNL